MDRRTWTTKARLDPSARRRTRVVVALAVFAAAVLPLAAADAKDPGAPPPGLAKKEAAAPATPAPTATPKGKATHAHASPGRAKHGRGPAPGQAKALSAPAAGLPANARPFAAAASTTTTQQIATYPQATSTPAAQTPTARRGAASRRAHASAVRRAAARRAAARHAAQRRAARRLAAAHRAAAVVAATPTAAPAPASAPSTGTRPRTQAAPRPKQRSHDTGVSVVTRTVTHTVRDIVNVIPAWAKALIAALAALLLAAAALILFGARRNRRLRRQRAALAEQVGVLQAALLPDVPPQLGALALSVAYRPAEGLAAGGDFYDVFPLEAGRVGIIVGDISGHGREALGPATSVRHMVRAYLEAGLAPRAALQLSGSVLDEQHRDEFATVVAAIHDEAAGTLSYATAGHPAPIVIGPAAHTPLTVASSPPLGVDSPTGLRQTIMPLPPGSTVCFYTDGLIEARTATGVVGYAEIERLVRELGPAATAAQIVEHVERRTDWLRDDVAVCLVHAKGGAAASTVRVEEIQVTRMDLDNERLRRFLTACRFGESDIESVIRTSEINVRRYGSIVLRVRLADDRSGVDMLPAESAPPAPESAPFRTLIPRSA